MKRFTILICMLALLALPLAGCADPAEEPGGAADTAGTETVSETRSIDYDAMDEEEAKVRRVADPAVMEQYGLTDLSAFEIDVHRFDWGEYSAIYRLKIQNYTTREQYSVDLSGDLTIIRIDDSDRGVYSPYLEAATEEAVKAAEERLKESTQNYDDSGYYSLDIDDEGNLCLDVEIIAHFAPLIDEYGNEIRGCGWDHDHLFFSEIICPKP